MNFSRSTNYLDIRPNVHRGAQHALVAAISLLCISSTNCAAKNSSWLLYYGQGQQALADQDLLKAETDFRKALSASSGNTPATEKCMMRLAATLTLRNEIAEASTTYLKLLSMMQSRYGKSSDKLPPVLMALGSIEESLGDHAAAMAYYQRALKINERNDGPYSPAIAANIQHLGKLDAARVALTQPGAGTVLQNPTLTSSQSQLKELPRDYRDMLNGSDQIDRSLITDFNKDVFPTNNNPKQFAEQNEASDNTKRIKQQIKIERRRDKTTENIIKNPGRVDPNAIAIATPNPNPSTNNTIEQLLANGSDNTSSSSNTTATANASSSASSNQPNDTNWQNQVRFRLNASAQSQSQENTDIQLRGMIHPSSNATLEPVYKTTNDTIFNQAHYEKGEDYYKRMIAADIDALGPFHPSVANDLTGLGRLYASQQRYAEAEPLFARALSIYEQVYGSNNILTINTRAALASAELHLGNTDKAADLYRNALSQAQSTLTPTSLETASILNDLAHVYFNQGKLQDAATFYEWAVASTESAVRPRDPLLAASLNDYAKVLRALGRTNEAIFVETRAKSILATAPPEQSH